MKNLIRNISHLMNHRKKLDDDGFADLIQKILSEYPSVGWELGPSMSDSKIDLLSLSVKDAPDFLSEFKSSSLAFESGVDWQVDIGIPPRDWELFFEATFEGTSINVEGGNWVWSTAQDISFDELVVAPADLISQPISETDLLDIGKILLVGELGEVNFMQHVKNFIVLRQPTKEIRWCAMSKLRPEFVNRHPECRYSQWLINNAHL
jgi:hypothetical protein